MPTPETAERPPVRVWRRLVLLTGTLVLSVIAFVTIQRAYDRHRTANELEALVGRLDADDPGWRLADLEAARPDPPPGQNSADVIVAVAKLMPEQWPEWETRREFEHLRFDGLPLARLLDAERAELLADEMAEMAPTLAQARRLADMLDGRHKFGIAENPWNTGLNDQQDSRKSTCLLRYDAWNLAQRGDLKGALLAGRACVNAGRSLGDEPTGISQIVRTACVVFGLGSVERSLSLGEASDADLAELQKLLRLEERHPTMLLGMRGERAMHYATFDAIAKKKVSAAEAFDSFGGPGTGVPKNAVSFLDTWFGLSGPNLPRQQLLMLKFQTEIIETANLPPQEQVAREAEIDNRVKALSRGDVFAKRHLAFIVKQNRGFRRKLGQVRAMDALLAVERHRLKNGRWPDRLEDIAKEMLPDVPLDPYDGAPVRYKRTIDGVVVYVLGDDLQDNGGDVEPPVPGNTPPDWGYRLWDVSKRRQPPPEPKPGADGPRDPGL